MSRKKLWTIHLLQDILVFKIQRESKEYWKTHSIEKIIVMVHVDFHSWWSLELYKLIHAFLKYLLP